MRFPVATRVPQSWSALRRTASAGFAAAAAAVVLTACGGGDQVDKFKPNKIVSFGDESSVLESEAVGSGELKGLKYTVNALVIERGVANQFSPALPVGAEFDTLQWGGDYPAATGTRSVVGDTNNSVVRFLFTADVAYKDAGGAAQTFEDATVGFDYLYACNNHRLWIQLLANGYGLGYQGQCGLDNDGAVTYAEAGARVSTDDNGVLSIKSQVAAHRAELNSKTLVTVMAGQNDILQEYFDIRDTPSAHEAANARMKAKGRELASIVNDMIKTGARVLIVTVPDLGLTPYARSVGEDRGLMTALTRSFNNGFVGAGGVINDGNKIGLVKFFDDTRNIDDRLSGYGFSNMTTALCTSARKPDGTSSVTAAAAPFFGGDELRYCNAQNVAGKNVFTYFWADEVNLSPGAHARLGNLAFQRADDNPF